jgi:uncharacterized membrane protein
MTYTSVSDFPDGGRAMSELVVVAFDKPTEADVLMGKLETLQKEHVITLEDAAVVVRKPDGSVKVKQAHNLVGGGALGGAFWGMLIGLLFWVPWLGLAIGALGGALAGKLTDVGIDDNFIKEVGATIKPGHSAAFLLVRDSTPDKVLDELKGFKGTVLKTSLSKENEEKLKVAFGAAE